MGALALGQLALLAVPVGVTLANGASVRALGLARARARHVLAALLIGASAWVLTSTLAGLIPHDPAERAALEALAQQPAAITIYLAIGLLPALCEEVLFRGVLARGLATHLRPAIAIGVTAIAFAAYHLNVAQLVPAFCLGLALGILTLRANSAVPAMVAHALNNVMALLVARGDAALLVRVIERHPHLVLGIATVLTASGLALTARTPA